MGQALYTLVHGSLDLLNSLQSCLIQSPHHKCTKETATPSEPKKITKENFYECNQPHTLLPTNNGILAIHTLVAEVIKQL